MKNGITGNIPAEFEVNKAFQLRILDLFSLFCGYWLCVIAFTFLLLLPCKMLNDLIL